MNSIVLPHPIALPRRPSFQKSLVSCGVGLALSAAFYWGILIKTVPSNEPSILLTPPNQAIYEWEGFHRVAPTAHLNGLNPL